VKCAARGNESPSPPRKPIMPAVTKSLAYATISRQLARSIAKPVNPTCLPVPARPRHACHAQAMIAATRTTATTRKTQWAAVP
jgi:hypothetical protein